MRIAHNMTVITYNNNAAFSPLSHQHRFLRGIQRILVAPLYADVLASLLFKC